MQYVALLPEARCSTAHRSSPATHTIGCTLPPPQNPPARAMQPGAHLKGATGAEPDRASSGQATPPLHPPVPMKIMGSPAAATLAAHHSRAEAKALGSVRPPQNWSTAYLRAGGQVAGLRMLSSHAPCQLNSFASTSQAAQAVRPAGTRTHPRQALALAAPFAIGCAQLPPACWKDIEAHLWWPPTG